MTYFSMAQKKFSNNCVPHKVVAPHKWRRESKGWMTVSLWCCKKVSTSGARVSQMVFPGLLFLYIYL